MLGKARLLCLLGLVFLVFAGVSCGKSDTKSVAQKGRGEVAKTAKSERPLEKIAKDAADEASLEDEFPEGRRVVEAAGFIVKSYKSFPSEEVTKRGRVLVYTDQKGKQSGGVLYLKKTGFQVAPAWHWYFENMVPDSASRVELNGDGLWDVRISMKGGKAEDYIQEQTFSLFAKERDDWIATNGTSSAPLSPDAAMWKCFDGDTTTAWKSSLPGAFLEFDVPFGVNEGTLSIATTATDQPKGCTVYANGNRVEDIELKPVSGRQVIALGQGVKGAKKIRLEFTSAHGNASAVGVAELGLK
jgi:hypothetical protein